MTTPPGAITDPKALAYNNFLQASQGPTANSDDHHRAGAIAESWYTVESKRSSFAEKAAAYFKLHDLLGTPIPDVYQQWATGMGIPRSVIDAAASQRSVGTGFSQGMGR
jgi:hypothetical protein